jgi:hypothetical protein
MLPNLLYSVVGVVANVATRLPLLARSMQRLFVPKVVRDAAAETPGR